MKRYKTKLSIKIEKWMNINNFSPFPIIDTEIINDAIKLNNMMIENNKHYNDVPVEYCDSCLSLKIKELESTAIPYCGVCGDASIKQTSIEKWEEKYKDLYGTSFIERNK